MSLHIAERILKPPFFAIRALVAGRGARDRHVIGFDSEAERGRPFMFQLNDHGGEADTEILDVPLPTPTRPHAPLDVLMSWLYKNCRDKTTEYIMVGWNLAYEWTQLFATLPAEVLEEPDYHILYTLCDDDGTPVARFNIRVMNSKRYSAVFTRLGMQCRESCTPDNHKCGSRRRIRLIDGMAYYVTSLDKAGAMLNLGRKLAKPVRFGRDEAQYPYFREYARQDAYLTRRIGENIVAMHDEFDVEQTISAPHFASTVYKRHFLADGIALPSVGLEQAGLSSYHGGKNGYYLAGPMHLSNMWSYDITSAYPEAMRALPDVELSEFWFVDEYQPGTHALWKITGQYRACRYHGLLPHDSGHHASGIISETWVTGYELDEALAQGEIELLSCSGYVMHGPEGGSLTRYVDRFFHMKRTTEGAARAAAKLFLNSLYGKFFQKVALGTVGAVEVSNEETGAVQFITTNPDQEFDYVAGGLYHPPIASLITGFVRAKIHRLEHKYDAVMTSTDGFFARNPPDTADLGKELGQLTAERGDLSIWRERLYCFTPTREDSEPKYALHGFRGTLADLVKIPLTPGSYSYKAQQMMTLRLSQHSHGPTRERYAPGEFATLTYTLDLTNAAGP